MLHRIGAALQLRGIELPSLASGFRGETRPKSQ
jgi:hypothetical protein